VSNYSIMIVDDDPEFGRFVGRAISRMGHSAEEAPNAHDFMLRYDELTPDVVFLDMIMPGIDGVEVTEWLVERHFKGKLVLMTGRDPSSMRAAQRIAEERSSATVATLEKPFRLNELREVLN